VTWLRVDADMPWHDKVVGLPNDTARFAFVKVLCAAKIRGRSAFSKGSLKEQLGSHARAIPALVAAGLIDVDEDGQRYSVHGFDEYQRRAGHAESQQRYRERSRGDHAGITETSPTEQDKTGRDKTSPPTPPRGTFMGMRPRSTALPVDDVKRQQDQLWDNCAKCGVQGRKHPAGGDHQFEVAA
jgi:hypothetical protein